MLDGSERFTIYEAIVKVELEFVLYEVFSSVPTTGSNVSDGQAPNSVHKYRRSQALYSTYSQIYTSTNTVLIPNSITLDSENTSVNQSVFTDLWAVWLIFSGNWGNGFNAK